MLQKVLAAIVTEEWAREYDASTPSAPPLVDVSTLARSLAEKILDLLQSDAPPAHHEMAVALGNIYQICRELLSSFHTECRVPPGEIPQLSPDIDLTGSKPNGFTLATAEAAVGEMFKKLKDSLGRSHKKQLAAIVEKRKAVVGAIERYKDAKTLHDIRVSAAFAAAFVALRSTPNKVSPIVKGIMNGIKVSFAPSAT
jgi:TATA-binding protein-associated factor